jgi:hypothetical protein
VRSCAKVRIIGNPDGSIIAAIITDHISKIAIMFDTRHWPAGGIISCASG